MLLDRLLDALGDSLLHRLLDGLGITQDGLAWLLGEE